MSNKKNLPAHSASSDYEIANSEKQIEKATAVERASDNLGTSLVATLLAAFSGTPVAALLPILVGSLASGRHKRRVETTIERISETLKEHSASIRQLSDAQYKLINEAALAVFSTVDQEKLEYLQRVVKNTLNDTDIHQQEAALLSRYVRDLSAGEARFLLEHENVSRFWFHENEPSESGALHIRPESSAGLVASGLVSLGLLTAAEATWDGSGMLRLAPIAPNLITLLKQYD